MNFDAVKNLFKPMGPEEVDRLVAKRYGRNADGTPRHVDMSVGLEDVGFLEVARVAARRRQRETNPKNTTDS